MNNALSAAALILVLLLSGGCSSTPEEKPKVVKKKKKKKPKVMVGELSKDSQRKGLVMFQFRDAWLRRDVLPVFLEQAGVKVRWKGAERKVTLRLTQPVHWEIALDLVCRFTKTHPTKDYRGQIVLKNGYGGSLGTSDEADETLNDAGAGSSGGGGGAPTSRSSSSRSTRSSSGGRAYRETVTNTRTGGADRSSGYNSGNQPSDLFNKIR